MTEEEARADARWRVAAYLFWGALIVAPFFLLGRMWAGLCLIVTLLQFILFAVRALLRKFGT